MTTEFEYVLNAMELAFQYDQPAEHGFAEKRRAVLDYVAELDKLHREACEHVRRLHADRDSLRSQLTTAQRERDEARENILALSEKADETLRLEHNHSAGMKAAP